MATYNVTGAVAGIPLGKKMQTVEVVLDFTSTNLAAGDIVNVFEIPDNTLVLMAGIEVYQAHLQDHLQSTWVMLLLLTLG